MNDSTHHQNADHAPDGHQHADPAGDHRDHSDNPHAEHSDHAGGGHAEHSDHAGARARWARATMSASSGVCSGSCWSWRCR